MEKRFSKWNTKKNHNTLSLLVPKWPPVSKLFLIINIVLLRFILYRCFWKILKFLFVRDFQVFKTRALNHSTTSPIGYSILLYLKPYHKKLVTVYKFKDLNLYVYLRKRGKLYVYMNIYIYIYTTHIKSGGGPGEYRSYNVDKGRSRAGCREGGCHATAIRLSPRW